MLLIAEHKWAAVTDAVQAPLQQETSPAPAHSSRANFRADSPLVPALAMFIETLKVRIKRWLVVDFLEQERHGAMPLVAGVDEQEAVGLGLRVMRRRAPVEEGLNVGLHIASSSQRPRSVCGR